MGHQVIKKLVNSSDDLWPRFPLMVLKDETYLKETAESCFYPKAHPFQRHLQFANRLVYVLFIRLKINYLCDHFVYINTIRVVILG